MRRVILSGMILLIFTSLLFAQTKTIQKKSGPSLPSGSSGTQGSTSGSSSFPKPATGGSKIEVYDLSIDDIYLDRDDKICVVLKLLEGVIPAGDFQNIRISFSIASLGSIPPIKLSQLDPQGELNSRKRKDINTNLVLRSNDTVLVSLREISDKNAQNNQLKKILNPKVSPVQQKTKAELPIPPPRLPSTGQMIQEQRQMPIPSGQGQAPSVATATGGTTSRIPGRQEGTLTQMSNQPSGEAPLPEVLNILHCPAPGSLVTPIYREVSIAEINRGEAWIDWLLWNPFSVENLKRIEIKISYIRSDGREVRINEFSRTLNDPAGYPLNYRDILNYLKNHRLITAVEPFKTYRFKITGSVTIEKPASSTTRSQGVSVQSEGQQAVTQTSRFGPSESTRRTIPTNSFDIYYFVKGQENTQVNLPSSEYQQVQAGIRIIPEPKNTEGRFKMELGGASIANAVGKYNEWFRDSCQLGISLSNFYLVVEEASDLSKKCSPINLLSLEWDALEEAARSYITITKVVNPGGIKRQYFKDGVAKTFSLLNDFLKKQNCRNIVSAEGKTLRVWAYADARAAIDKPGRKCPICEERSCKYENELSTSRYFIYSPPQYITIYKPEDIPPESQMPASQDLPGIKPRKLGLNHQLTTLSIGPLGLIVPGAKITIAEPVKVNWQESARGFPAGMQAWIRVQRAISGELIVQSISEGTSAEIRPERTESTVAGSFPAGFYKVSHAFCYPGGTPMNPLGGNVPVCTDYSDPVYFESYMPISKVNLRLRDFQLTPRDHHHGLKVKLSNLSPQALTADLVSGVSVFCDFDYATGIFSIPTPIPASSGESSGQVIFEIPSGCNLLSHKGQQTVTLRIPETELWGPASITQTFTIPQQERSNFSFAGNLSFLRSNDGRQITVSRRVVEDLRGRSVGVPYKVKLRISKSGGRIIHEEEFEQTVTASLESRQEERPISFTLNKDEILRKSGGTRHLAVEVIVDWEGKYDESNEGDNRISAWYDF